MRVVAGQFKKMKLNMVDSKLTRPTTDKVKEAIFSIIFPYIKEGGIALDLYAGSGSLGIEAASRGYEKVYLIDHAKPAIDTINKNIASTKKPENFVVLKQTANNVIENFSPDLKFDLVLLDPPYAKQQIVTDINHLQKTNHLADDAIIVAETDEHGYNSINQNFDKKNFEVIANKEYGITFLTIFRRIK